jgi:hypothetical protein
MSGAHHACMHVGHLFTFRRLLICFGTFKCRHLSWSTLFAVNQCAFILCFKLQVGSFPCRRVAPTGSLGQADSRRSATRCTREWGPTELCGSDGACQGIEIYDVGSLVMMEPAFSVGSVKCHTCAGYQACGQGECFGTSVKAVASVTH